jgi:SAM-dependent methyltransferase
LPALLQAQAELQNLPPTNPRIPPVRLIHLVSGTYSVEWFLKGGELASDSIRHALTKNGVDLASLRSVLDFGCGCGRVVRHLGWLNSSEIHGTDYNPSLVRWCVKNLRFARFGTNKLNGQLPYEEEKFDLIYALSVFTHLPAGLQREWLAELRRVLRPGGYLIITTHGRACVKFMSEQERDELDKNGVVVRGEVEAGDNRCMVIQTEQQVRAEMGRGFEVIDYIEEGAWGNPPQDMVVMRKTGELRRNLHERATSTK